jgi:purine-binding chemotaxis protein CheW
VIDDKTEILKARAKALGREPESADAAGERVEVLEFVLAYERYGIESRFVREVYPLKALTPVPCTPAFVLGIINVRGRIFSVIDIKTFFELPEQGLAELSQAVIVGDGAMEFGILADSIMGFRFVSTEDILPSLPTLTGIRQDYLKGITKDRMVILDTKKLLSEKALVVHEGYKTDGFEERG